MKIKKITFHKLPGFKHGGFTLSSLSPSLNIIAGPNGSGKTSICLAVQKLLWPEKYKNFSPASVESEWEYQQHSFSMSLEEGNRVVGKEGNEYINLLPGEHLSSCFNMTLDEIFTADDREFAHNISKEIAGGYDICEAEKQLFVAPNIRQALKDRNSAKDLFDQYLKKQKSLEKDKESLPDLEEAIQKTGEAVNRVQTLKKVIEAKSLLSDIEESEIKVQKFPEQIVSAKIDPTDWIEYKKYAEQAEEISLDIEKLKLLINDPANVFGSENPDPVSDDEIESESERIRRIRKLQDDKLYKIMPAYEQARLALDNHARFLGVLQPDSMNNFHIENPDLIHIALEKTEISGVKIEGIRAQINVYSDIPDSTGENSHAGIEILTELTGFLRSRRRETALCILGILSSAAYFFAFPFYHPFMLLLSLPLLFVFLQTSVDLYKIRELKRRYSRSSSSLPVNWKFSSVLQHLFDSTEIYAKEILQKEQSKEKKRLLKILEEEEKVYHVYLNDLLSLGKDCGMEFPSISRYRFAGYFKELHEARLAFKIAENELERIEKRFNEEDFLRRKFISRFNFSFSDTDEPEKIHEALVKKILGIRKIQTSIRELAALDKKLSCSQEKAKEILTKTNCVENPRQLQQFVSLLPAYRDLCRVLEEQKNRFENLKRELGENSDLIEKDIDFLREDLIKEEDRASAYTKLCEDRAVLKNRLHEMETSFEGQTRSLHYTNKCDEVKKAALRFAGNSLTALLIKEVEEAYVNDSRPQILRLADERFRRFTKNAFSLRTPKKNDRGLSTFEAIHNATGECRAIDALSGGTRIQLLIAVRLAFQSDSEKVHPTLPLFLDEVLANSDPERFNAVSEVLAELANEGKQIFYFTCNPEEIPKWKEKRPDLFTFDLAEIQKEEAFIKFPLLNRSVIPKAIPRPESECMVSYAQLLKIPALNVSRPLEMASVYYLSHTPELLYRLLNAGISVYGDYISLKPDDIQKKFSDVFFDMEKRKKILERFYQIKNIGRGTRVPASAFEEKFVPKHRAHELLVLSRELDDDAKKIMEVLDSKSDARVKSLQKRTVEGIRKHFIESGFLDERPALDNKEIRRELFPYILDETDQTFLDCLLLSHDVFEVSSI